MTTLAIVAMTALAACGEGVREAAPATTLTALGACDADQVAGAPAGEFVSRPGAWLRVRSIDLTSAQDATFGTTEAIRGTYEVVGGDAAATDAIGSQTVGVLTMHGSIAKDIQQGLALTSDVYTHTGGGGDVGKVDFALAIGPTDFAFLGECQSRLLTAPLKRIFGADAQAKVSGFVGDTGDVIAAAFPQPAPAPSPVSILNPDTAPADLLARLSVIRFTLPTRPASWVGPYAICTKIAEGWSDCLDLSRTTTSTHAADAYYDPANPTLEVWLVNGDADLSKPLARLATVDLAQLSRASSTSLTMDALRLVGTLSPSRSASAIAEDASLATGSFSGFGLSVP